MLSLLLSKVGGWFAAAAALFVALLAAWGLARRSGEKAQQSKDVSQALTDSKDANEIDDKVRSMSDASLDKRLSEFTRPK
jgi:hypothetical protein